MRGVSMESFKHSRTDEDPLSEDRKFRRELSSGITALALLGILDAASAPLYGYSIAKRMEETGDGARIVKHGTLYPVLRSLEGSGLLESTVEPSVSGPPRRYYGITAAGREALGRWKRIWEETSAFIGGLIGGGQDDQGN
jgi:PadR family transcriptional regulator, regulatory protein PadR